MNKAGVALSACVLAFLGWIAFVLDEMAYVSHGIVFQLIFLSIGAIVLGLAVWSGRMTALLAPSLYILWILVLPFLNSTPVKPAVLAVEEIQPGMTEAEVRAVIDRHFPENGPFKRPAIGPLTGGAISFALDPNDGRYNAAIVVVRFSQDKVLSAEFLPD